MNEDKTDKELLLASLAEQWSCPDTKQFFVYYAGHAKRSAAGCILGKRCVQLTLAGFRGCRVDCQCIWSLGNPSNPTQGCCYLLCWLLVCCAGC